MLKNTKRILGNMLSTGAEVKNELKRIQNEIKEHECAIKDYEDQIQELMDALTTNSEDSSAIDGHLDEKPFLDRIGTLAGYIRKRKYKISKNLKEIEEL